MIDKTFSFINFLPNNKDNLLNLNMTKLKWLISFLAFLSSLFGDCDGFNWYHNINLEDCDPVDINVLQRFITNSGNSLEIDMDVNYNGEV